MKSGQTLHITEEVRTFGFPRGHLRVPTSKGMDNPKILNEWKRMYKDDEPENMSKKKIAAKDNKEKLPEVRPTHIRELMKAPTTSDNKVAIITRLAKYYRGPYGAPDQQQKDEHSKDFESERNTFIIMLNEAVNLVNDRENKDTDLILVPMLLNDCHYILVSFNLKQTAIEIMDSFTGDSTLIETYGETPRFERKLVIHDLDIRRLHVKKKNL
ncbi:hypothetical protein V2J09_016605 [Rumex salicifolius]